MRRMLGVAIIALVCLSTNLAQGDSSWHIQTVDSVADWGLHSSLALDSSGYPHIAYHDMTGWELKYVKWDGSEWVFDVVCASSFFRHNPVSLALDSDDNAHISFQWVNDLRYAEWDGSAWIFRKPGSPRYSSLALDSDGNAHFGIGEWDLYYSMWDGSSWIEYMRSIDASGRSGKYNAIAVDENDSVHISYYRYWDGGSHVLRYARGKGSSWTVETVDGSGEVGLYTSLALDSSGCPHISYYDATNGDLKYVKWDGSDWLFDIVDSDGNVGSYTSLALDSSGYPHITYYDDANADLKYAYEDSLGWHTETVASTGLVGTWNSLVLDQYGFAHISYFDATSGKLKYASNIPEPTTIALFGLGLLGLGAKLRRRKRS